METIVRENGALYVGSPVERIEDAKFLTGTGQFVDDLLLPGMLHAVLFRSSMAHGAITRIDVSGALALDGVHAVFTAEDLGADIPLIPIRLAPLPEFQPFRQPVIARSKVRYVGEPIAVVVADSRAIAEDAMELIEVDIDPLPVAYGKDCAAESHLFDGSESGNIATRYATSMGDPDTVFERAAHVRTERFSMHRQTALPMETRGLVADWNAQEERLRVLGAAKVPFFNRKALAGMMQLEQDAVDLIEVDIGGGFGVRGEFYPEDYLIPFASRRLGRPVKWIEDRREHLMATNHSREMTCELSLACSDTGEILAIRGRIDADMGAYIRTNGGVVPAKAAQFLPGPYRIKHVSLDVAAHLTNKTPVGTYRGPGRFEANFFRERLIDLVAADLAIDPAEFRRRNLITEPELPWDAGKLVPYEAQTEFDTGDYPQVFERCLAEIGWADRLPLQGKLIDGKYHGLGLGCFVESGGAGPRENAKIVVNSDGTVTVSVGSSMLGQGLATAHAQIAADTLSVPIERIEILHGSTTLLSEGFGTYHARGVVMGGSAVLNAAEKLRELLIERAFAFLGRPNGKLGLRNGRIELDDSAGVDFATLASAGELMAEGTFANTTRTYSYGTHAAYVTVTPDTGAVEIVDYVAVEDVGRVINPLVVHGQAIGALVQGLGGVFLDHLVYDDEGQLLNGSLADYLVPTATDFSAIRAVTLELKPSPSNPLGAKGAGEGGIVAVAAATANAVAAALSSMNVQISEMPLTPPRIWKLIQNAKAHNLAR